MAVPNTGLGLHRCCGEERRVGLVETLAVVQKRQAIGKGWNTLQVTKSGVSLLVDIRARYQGAERDTGDSPGGPEWNCERAIHGPSSSGHAASFGYRFCEE
jgi:hypothetical protein